jgi:hypothetical protein
LHENTTVTGQWVSVIDTPKASKAHGRAVNNISLAMPHSGVFQAARDQRNDIMQPEELDSEGTYTMRASVVSPVVNVLCANMNEEELAPLIYAKWNGAHVNGTSWKSMEGHATTTNETKVDELFGWTKKNPLVDYPPVFAKLPRPFNTIMNHTSQGWGRDSVYLLGQGGVEDNADRTGIYVLCKLHVSITPDCSTRYTATGIGGSMEAHCEDPDDEMAYSKTHPEAKGVGSVANWMAVAFDWANSLSLNTGIADADASNSRLLTQLILSPSKSDPEDIEVDLNPELPSVAEALAVMAGSTLLKSMLMAPYVDSYVSANIYSSSTNLSVLTLAKDYDAPLLDHTETQYFPATINAQQYASGGPDSGSKAWILVLFLVFLMNIVVLVYFICHNGIVTDFSEPPTLFALAVNSPPSHVLAGSCGGGPRGKQFTINWFVNNDGDHLYMEPGEQPIDDEKHGHVHTHGHAHNFADGHTHRPVPQSSPPISSSNRSVHEQPANTNRNSVFSAITSSVDRLRDRGLQFGPKKHQQRMRPVSVAVDAETANRVDLEDNNTRIRRQYEKLANRRSMF